MIQDILPRDQLPAGIALTHAAFQTAMFGGPAIAGFLAGLWGVTGCYVVVVATLMLAFAGLAALPQSRQVSGSESLSDRLGAGLRAVLS